MLLTFVFDVILRRTFSPDEACLPLARRGGQAGISPWLSFSFSLYL
jgi:hypothetical protein